MKKGLTVFVGFVHDFAAGCWAATVLAVYWLSASSVPAELSAVMTDLKRQFFYLSIGCALLVFATGAGRTFTYVDNFYGEDAERQRRRMLIVKHLFLFLIFGLGIFWQYMMVYR
ncbi:MAG: hypothetical protein M0Z71_08915 [Nitrospiraceae bacterium]|nr:hypothetical protein [Nitrospiraceae bacterium]